ncbi:Serine protease snake [Pseudolycoriella hygida]|uniref:Serine protease snake n=1 Tax=Pseudolycoriella hygida TaxID=35572 RepID=A0A9Q0MRT3_9DIPT|nr:Serine protease snake [Pseudolycoriella hygida]
MMSKTLILFWSLIFGVIFVDGQLSEGDRCNTRTGQSGTCTKISGCVSVQNDIRNRRRDHVVCGYEGFVQVVCCPGGQATTTTTRRPISNRISARKCTEYAEFAYNKIYITNVFGPPTERKVSNCAYTSVPLIVGGTEANVREFPHMALIGFEDGNTIHWDCGGTLISEQFVLSAAHCFDSRDYGPARYVRLGEHDLNRKDDGTVVDLRIIQSIPHPDYRYPIQYNDIGLFKLERRVELNGAIRPACLPEQSAVQTKSAIATGWGTVSWRGRQSNALLKVTLDMFTEAECNRTYSSDINRKLNRGILEESQVCAGSHKEEKDSCQGDSGGPLQIYHDTHHCTYTIVGVTSFGKACGTIGTPGVYTRVYAFLNWIEKIVWPNQ